MLILAIIVFGMAIGALAQVILGRRTRKAINWGLALAAGLLGSFVGALIFSLIAGDGFALEPSGVIGSIVGAIVVTLVYEMATGRRH